MVMVHQVDDDGVFLSCSPSLWAYGHASDAGIMTGNGEYQS